MITSVVNALYEALIHVGVRDTNGDEQDIETIVDTGFTGHILLWD